MKEAIVQFIDLEKNIGSKKIIKGLSFDVYPGEVFGFLGPNGAGKTTTIRMLFGLMKITKGKILIDGHSVAENFEKAVANIGGIVENPEMYQYMSGYKNLRLYARMHNGISKERIDEVVAQVGLQNRIKDKVKTYSLGMRQRLGLAQALLHNPKVIVLDEPTNGLDPAGIKEFRSYLRKIAREENVAVIVSSHLLSEMELMCDRIGIIQNGELVSIKDVGEDLEDDGQVRMILDARPIEKALHAINESVIEGVNVSIVDDNLELYIKENHVPLILKVLINADVDVYEYQRVVKTLEDQFIELTGGNEIA